MPFALGLRTRFTLYLIIVHILIAAVGGYLLTRQRAWLLAVEAVFLISLLIGFKLIRSLFGTIELINTGAQFIEDKDFTSRFREMGQPEMDRLVNVYNQMVDHLRNERIKLQEQNFFLERVINASPSGIVTLDFEGRIAMVNRAAERMLGSEARELIGKAFGELNTAFGRSLAEIASGAPRVLPLAGRRKVKCQRSQFLDRGFPREFLLMEELTEELRQTEKLAYEKVIRLMSHEVNNSIGSANSLLHSCLLYAAQLCKEDRDDFETALRVVIGRTDHLNQFMRNFADIFRIPHPHLQRYDLGEMIEKILFLYKSELASRNIEIKFDVQEGMEQIQMDRSQMEQVVINLLKNAIEAIGQNGRIRLQLQASNGTPSFSIEDTGAGISDRVRANLFTPFFSTKDNGQGIGLTLVQEILDQHKFEFALESQSGGPTKFTIYF